ncbi:GDSL-type esterase/lipase family protein [Marinicrinis sediminis]|uniref:GDSL-type esterase/lipase family protein n=1 Tax=Marinicrinis sediminis TaxID=1652465 RepID=A0ABW5R737_9BACL
MKRVSYTAIGDSLTAGYGAPSGRGFVPIVASMVGHRIKQTVTIYDYGVNGATSSDMLHGLRTNSLLRAHIGESQLLTITSGGNDLIEAAKSYIWNESRWPLNRALVTIKHNIAQMLQIIQSIKGKDSYQLILLELYDLAPDMAEVGRYIQAYNAILHGFSSRHIRIAPIYRAFQHRERYLLSGDGVHPNEAGYRVMADAVYETIQFPIVRTHRTRK